MTSITTDARTLRDLKAQKAEAAKLEKDLTGQVQRAQVALKERMEEEGHDGIKTDGLNFVPAETMYGQVQDRAAFVEWALENEPELVEYKERAELVNELARECIDDGRALPPGLGYYVREYVSVRAG